MHKSVSDAAKRSHVIIYSELPRSLLRWNLNSGLFLTEAGGCEDEIICCDEEGKGTETQVSKLADRSISIPEDNEQIHPNGLCSELAATTIAPIIIENDLYDDEDRKVKKPSILTKVREKKLERRQTRSLVLLNMLAALYGSGTVASKFATDVAPVLPASLATLVRFSSALLVFLPAVIGIIHKDKKLGLLKAGAELGVLLFGATVLETSGDGGASSDAPLLFAFTVMFFLIIELCTGRQSVRNLSRTASIVALSGMGVLEEEGIGWKGISLPQVGDLWGLAASALYVLHIFRSEAHSSRFQAYQLTAIQCGTVTTLSLAWELCRVIHGKTSAMAYMSQLKSLPWCPLVYTGFVCAGLCGWLEIHGLRSVHASTAIMVNTTIPIWGAFLSFLLRGEALGDSAIVGGSIILAASLSAQTFSKQDETGASSPTKISSSPHCHSTSKPSELPVQCHDDFSQTPTPKSSATKQAADHTQGAIITSQLKFPYYAVQAKRLLLEAKFKLLSLKSLVMSATSSLMINTPPRSLHSPSTTISTSASLQQAANVVNNGANSSSLSQLSVTGTHETMMAQLLDIANRLLESAIVALGSEIVQAVEEAEDLAVHVEQGVHKLMSHFATIASSTQFLLSPEFTSRMSGPAGFHIFNALEIKTTLGVNTLNYALPLLSHHADAIVHILTCPPDA